MNFPPKPYALLESATAVNNGSFHLYLVDANGRKIAALWGTSDEKLALGKMIVEASGGTVDAVPVVQKTARLRTKTLDRLDEMAERSAARAART